MVTEYKGELNEIKMALWMGLGGGEPLNYYYFRQQKTTSHFFIQIQIRQSKNKELHRK